MCDLHDSQLPSKTARVQTFVSLAVALAVLATCVGIDLLARNERLAGWVQSRRLRRWVAADSTYQHALGFVDFEHRLLLDEIPRADYSRGGVYFIGSSTVVMSLMTWELPTEWRELIHNYGISGADHTQQFHFVRHLVEHEGLLTAGGEKTTIVLGLFYGNAAPNEGGPNGRYIGELFRNQGLFRYDEVSGIQPVAMPDSERFVRYEKARCGNFLRRSLYNSGLSGDLNIGIRPDIRPTPNYTIRQRQEFWQRRMGADWTTTMAEQVDALARMVDYLQERNVRVLGVFLPMGSWQDELPYAEAYRHQVVQVCRKDSVPLIDLADLLEDKDFSDSVHFRCRGQRKLHARLTQIAVEQLGTADTFPEENRLARRP
ncbi:MAG TPA: SGNH/GDSL hydrolase family protein [Thermoguttaceae bacterium]|nr:SGNH/GDSL hydrolase family protein [Thermoguttaceae bacterium]